MSRKPHPSAPSLPPLGIVLSIGAVAWFLFARPSVAGGKEWRGYTGTVMLKPAVVYRIEMVAPLRANLPGDDLSTAENQAAMERKLASIGARNFLWNVVPDGVHLYFDQSFSDPSTLTFGKSGPAPLVALTARRIDGLDWEAP